MKDMALSIVKALKEKNIPAFIFGSVARDILLNRKSNRKDIDIIITTNDNDYMLLTHSVMTQLSSTLIAESYLTKNRPFKELWILEKDDKMYLIEIHYVHLRYDMPLPRPIKIEEENYYILPPDLLFFTLMAQLTRPIPYKKRREVIEDINKIFSVNPKVEWR